jgi:dihydroflavonol-4-reductase
MNKENKILITGSTGFLGSYVTRLLFQHGYKNIRCLKRSSSRTQLLEDFNLNFIDGNILDVPFLTRAMNGIDTVIHTAATVSYDPKKSHLLRKINIEGTANVINAALEAGVKQLIHVSSIAALGRSKSNHMIDEKTPWQNSKYNTPYAISKYHGELEAWRGYAEGLQVSVLNPSFIIGAGYWDQSSVKLISKLAKGLSFYPKGTNGFVDVRDVAIAVERLLCEDHSGEKFIISAENRTYKDLFTLVSSSFEKPLPSRPLGQALGTLAVWGDSIRSFVTGNEAVLTRRSLHSTSTHSFYDNQKSIDSLRIKYRPLSKTIEETVECYKNTHDKGFGVLPF